MVETLAYFRIEDTDRGRSVYFKDPEQPHSRLVHFIPWGEEKEVYNTIIKRYSFADTEDEAVILLSREAFSFNHEIRDALRHLTDVEKARLFFRGITELDLYHSTIPDLEEGYEKFLQENGVPETLEKTHLIVKNHYPSSSRVWKYRLQTREDVKEEADL